MFRFLKLFLAPCLLLVFVCLPIQAQSVNATLSGVVEDEKGAVIPGVKVTITNPETGFESSVITNSSGAYAIPLLPPATYTVTAEQTGFTRVQFPDIVLNVNDQRSLRIELKVGSVEAAIEVRPDETLLDTSPSVSTTVDRTFVGNLPLNARSFQSLILLTPGVVPSNAGGSGTGQFSVNGQRPNANYFTVDGVSANASGYYPGGGQQSQALAGLTPDLTAVGTTQSLVSVDALEEFKIQTSTYTAEFGRQPGGQIQLVTRGGTDQFHGSAFEYLRNEAMEANGWFANAAGGGRLPLRQNQFGGTFSGPVFLPAFGDGGPSLFDGRKRTHFFFSYEGLRLLLPGTASTLVPSLRLRGIAASSVKPFLEAFPLPTGSELTDADGAGIGLAPFVTSYSNPSSTDATSIRVDHVVNSKLSLFGRYGHTPSSNLSRQERNIASLFGGANTSQTLTLGATSSFSSKLTNEFRFNWTRSRGQENFSMDDFGGAVPVDPATLVFPYSEQGVKDGEFGVELPSWEGLSLPPGGISFHLGDQTEAIQRQINIVNNLSWIKGPHQLKLGFDYRRLAPVVGQLYKRSTELLSEDDITDGTGFVRISFNRGAELLFNNFSAYVQDTWKVNRRLTLDLGLRWELNPPPRDANGLRPILVSLSDLNDLSSATFAPPDAPVYETSYTALAPRVGFAYQLGRTNGWERILRGGFGVYYDLNSGAVSSYFRGFPFVGSKNLGQVALPISEEQAQSPAFQPITLPFPLSINATNPDLSLPYTLQWNLAVEQAIGSKQSITLSYVAAAGRSLLYSQSLNNPPTGSPRPNPNFQGINYISNGPSSDYHSFQAQFQRRLSSGLQTQANYTWSHAIDEVSDQTAAGVLERGNANFDRRHNFSAAVYYEIPKLFDTPVIRQLLNNWSVDSAIYVQSGGPMEVTAGSVILSDGTRVSIRSDLIGGVPIWIEDSNAPGGQRLNFAAFARPPRNSSGVFERKGTLGRNVITPPGLFQVNFGLRRRINLTERVKLELRGEAFNLFNRPQFTSYGTSLSSPSTFGLATDTLDKTLSGTNSLYQLGGARSIQLSMRLTF